MKIQAQQGDTVDLLCYRYYGYTQSVVERVLQANPDLCLSTVIPLGYWVELPEFIELQQKEIIQLWD